MKPKHPPIRDKKPKEAEGKYNDPVSNIFFNYGKGSDYPTRIANLFNRRKEKAIYLYLTDKEIENLKRGDLRIIHGVTYEIVCWEIPENKYDATKVFFRYTTE